MPSGNAWWKVKGVTKALLSPLTPLTCFLSTGSSAFKRWQVDEKVRISMSGSMIRLTLDTRIFAHSFGYVNGILYDLYNQKAAMGWHPASTGRLVVSFSSRKLRS